MKKPAKMIGIIAILAVIGIFMAGCEAPESPPPVLSGTVSKIGSAQVGQTLVADTSALSGSGTKTYQWMRGGTAAIGSNSNTYTVQAADVGFVITVTVSRSCSTGSITSVPTAVVTIANQNPITSDFDIDNLTQTAGNVKAVTVTPKAGKSTGTITVFYNGATTLPTTIGTYTITFNVAAATGWNEANGLAGGTLTINLQVNAQNPSITSQPVSATVAFNASHTLSVLASVTDGGTLSYSWFSNTSSSNIGGTPITSNNTTASYSPSTNTSGTFFYFVEVTNTITNNGDGGNKTATIRSDAVTLTVSPAQGTAGINLTVEQIINKAPIYNPIILSRSGTGYPTAYTVSVNAFDYDTGSILWEVAGVGIYSGQTVSSRE